MKIWFQNRRMKWRNSKERELIAHGGCREQTLPTKHNPNPDLSDPVNIPPSTSVTAPPGTLKPLEALKSSPSNNEAKDLQFGSLQTYLKNSADLPHNQTHPFFLGSGFRNDGGKSLWTNSLALYAGNSQGMANETDQDHIDVEDTGDDIADISETPNDLEDQN